MRTIDARLARMSSRFFRCMARHPFAGDDALLWEAIGWASW